MVIKGEINVPGDKSVSHRALLLNSIAFGEAKIYNILNSADVLATMECLMLLGVNIENKEGYVKIVGNGINALKESKKPLNAKNSGTTARLISGILASSNFDTEIIGDNSLSKRPMKRISEPLSIMGAHIELTKDNYLPIRIIGKKLKGIQYKMTVSSAQVKSAIILAAINSLGNTIIYEKDISRDHTEKMLKYLGANIKINKKTIMLEGDQKLTARDIVVPGDISSAAFFIIATLLVPGSELLIKDCGINPTRTGILDVMFNIGANIEIRNKKVVNNEQIADIFIRYTNKLKPFNISGALIPRLIDEIPILSLLATQIEGVSTIKNAEELLVKETNRIETTAVMLNKLGANIETTNDGMIIKGKTKLHESIVETYHDHRISMMLKVANLLVDNKLIIKNSDCDKISYPNFESDLNKIIK